VTLAYVGIGANLGSPAEQVEQAFEALGALPGTRVVSRSSLYRSEPLGYAGQPDFVNAVAAVETSLAPEALLAGLQAIETAHGRERPFPSAPRTLDLDLLLYGDAVIDQPGLRVPHPRMCERAFVLAPLLEIDPGARIPGAGSAERCLAACSGQGVQRMG
jgi:2-amino-4-hydroxy-6-hydroxymethyldihydropteridine diphosphokinase